jgi:aryl-alcohol dehydrogenase-like predicted oxidoreductase
MNKRLLNSTGRTVSEIGLGCWQLGGDWGDVPEERAFEILRTAVDHGIDFFDTADVYGGGRSEELIGKFLKESKANVFVASKLGRSGDPGWPENFTEAAMRRHTENSLRRLQVDSLDLTQLHCIPTEELRRGDVFDTLRKFKQEGLIKSFGASVESMEEALICLQQEGLASLQIIFNIFRQKPAIDTVSVPGLKGGRGTVFQAAQAKNVALIVRLPIASGLLSGKMTKNMHFAASDHRHYNRDGQAFNVGETFAGLPFERGVDLADTLKPFVPEGMTMAQFALRWILDFPAVTTVIPGASRPDQARANADVSAISPLGEQLHAKLRAFYEVQVADHIRGPY